MPFIIIVVVVVLNRTTVPLYTHVIIILYIIYALQVRDYKEQLASKENEVSKITEQCTHLVRISEQRRQENLSLQAKMNVMKNKSCELLQQQETSASSAVVGLSALGNRLDSLLDRLVKSYSISEVDIEV